MIEEIKQFLITMKFIFKRILGITMTKDDFFIEENVMMDSMKQTVSPSSRYVLTICQYTTSPGCWNYSRGTVVDTETGTQIADVKRNYHSFWHCFVQHSNGCEYLLCGENYQGYTVINLTRRTRHDYLPAEAKQGHGFCWAACTQLLGEVPERVQVHGCYWGGPYETVTIDFSNPEQLPLPEISREWLDEDDGDDDEDDGDEDSDEKPVVESKS